MPVSRILRGGIGILALLCAASEGVAQEADADLIRKGRAIWVKRECGSCHGIDATAGGPALEGLTQRRSREWLYRWLKDSKSMVVSDSIGRELMSLYKVAMPSQKLSPRDVDALLAYIEDRERRVIAERKRHQASP
jgi:mono/diheme cytochrome c family protein